MTEQQNPQSGSQDHVNQLVDLADAERRTRVVVAAVPPGRARQRRARVALAFTTPILLAMLLVIFGTAMLESLLEKKLTPAAAQEEARQTLNEVVADIESFRHDYNELPETLVEIGVPSRGKWTYAVTGKDAYRVQGSVQGQSVTFDSPKAGVR